MKTYRVAGTATEWSPSGVPQEVTRLESVEGLSGVTYSIPVTLRMQAETSRKGVRRVVIQAGAVIPGPVMNDLYNGINADPKVNTPISAHIVLQGPQVAFMSEQGMNAQAGFLQLVCARLVSDLVAIVTNESPGNASDNKLLSGLIARALTGSGQLDIVSGTYGTATAS